MSVGQIKETLKEKGMTDHKNLYLCASVASFESCKMTLEYTSEDDGFKELTLDSFESVKMLPNSTKLFKISSEVESFVKIARITGFPLVTYKLCKG